MNSPDLSGQLAPFLQPQALLATGGESFGLQLPQGPRLTLRYVQAHNALCVAAPLGCIMQSNKLMVLQQLMLANTELAHAGKPHYAITPEDGSVLLCHTVHVEASALESALDELVEFVALWQVAREGAMAAQLLRLS